tara:strand:+ start:143 stop:325 length:183 start_codon:yes stop_codon:yes gene_type:complete
LHTVIEGEGYPDSIPGGTISMPGSGPVQAITEFERTLEFTSDGETFSDSKVKYLGGVNEE